MQKQDKKLNGSAAKVRHKRKSSVSKVNVQVDRVALHSLRPRLSQFNVERKALSSLKSASMEEGDEKDSASLAVARSLFSPNIIYEITLSGYGSQSSSVIGVLAGSNSFDPSSGFTEWSSLTALFNEVRCVSFMVQYASINPHSDGYAAGRVNSNILVACDKGVTAYTPANRAAVQDCPKRRIWNTGSTEVLTYVAHLSPLPEFASTAAPAPAPYAGCYGVIAFYGSGFTVSTAYFETYYRGTYQFTSRT